MIVKITDFTEFELSEEEKAIAYSLSAETKAELRNLMADAAKRKARLLFDPQNPLKFAQAEAELSGQIIIIQSILNASDFYMNQN